MRSFPLAAGRLLCTFLLALQGFGHQHGACGDQRTRGACVQHALAGVLRIPSAGALRGASMMRKAVHLLAFVPVRLVSGSADQEVRSQLCAGRWGAVRHLARWRRDLCSPASSQEPPTRKRDYAQKMQLCGRCAHLLCRPHIVGTILRASSRWHLPVGCGQPESSHCAAEATVRSPRNSRCQRIRHSWLQARPCRGGQLALRVQPL